MWLLSNLTPSQHSKMTEYAGKAFSSAFHPRGPIQKELAELAVLKIYQKASLPMPEKIYWFPSPEEALPEIVLRRNQKSEIRSRTLESLINQAISSVDPDLWQMLVSRIWANVWDNGPRQVYEMAKGAFALEPTFLGCYEAGRIHLLAYFRDVLGMDWAKAITPFEQLLNAGWWWALNDAAIMTEPPAIHLDDRGRFHRSEGKAIEWPDGKGFYFVRGVRVPDIVVEHPERISFGHIQHEGNSEVRRVMIEKMGWDRFLSESGAVPIHTDEFGTLYRIAIERGRRNTWDFQEDEPVCLVKVVNSTPEPDGTFKNYILRVDPRCVRAKQAVAWTFGLDEKDYKPDYQT